MGVFSKLKDFMGIEEIDEDDDDEELEEYVEPPKTNQVPSFMEHKPSEMRPAPPRAQSVKPEPGKSELSQSAGKSQTFGGNKYTNQFKLVVIEPSGFDESPKLVDSLKAKKPVIINLENLETDVARKIFDFLSGATYALNGNVQKVANNIFVFAPENVDVSYNMNKKEAAATNAIRSPWNK